MRVFRKFIFILLVFWDALQTNVGYRTPLSDKTQLAACAYV